MSNFLHKYGQLLAYVAIALAFLFTANGLHDQSVQGDRDAAANRIAIIDAGAKAVAVGCGFDLETNTSLRNVIKNSQIRIEGLYKEGSLTLAQVRVYRVANKEALTEIPIPNCSARVASFVATTQKAPATNPTK